MKCIPSNRSIEKQMLDAEILDVFMNSKKRYGSPRVTRELHKKNIKVSRVRVARMMKKAKLRSIVKKKFKIPIKYIFLYRKIYLIGILNQVYRVPHGYQISPISGPGRVGYT